jgi:hypothetical protein
LTRAPSLGLFVQPAAGVGDAAAQCRDLRLDGLQEALGKAFTLLGFCGFLAGLGLLLIGALEPAFQTFAVVGGVLIQVAVLGLLAHEIEQIRLGGFQLLVHLCRGQRSSAPGRIVPARCSACTRPMASPQL